MQKSSFKLEKKLLQEGYDFIVGIDEAGRGPLAGPVVACAVTFKNLCHPERSEGSRNNKASCIRTGFFADAQNDKLFNLIRDSKTLSHKQRENLFGFIHEHFYVGVGICDHKTVDRMNILQASFLAMKKAITDLLRKSNFQFPITNFQKNSKFQIPNSKFIILLDGNKPIPNFSGEQKAIINGDKFVKSISAASIIAKVTRDRIMLKMHKKYPHYHFHKHKGYGTKLHMEVLAQYGPCEIHRRSFKPVKLARKKK